VSHVRECITKCDFYLCEEEYLNVSRELSIQGINWCALFVDRKIMYLQFV
jgi:hypothetical protein